MKKDKDIKFADIDFDRLHRRGFPEVIYCPGKSLHQITEIAKKLVQRHGSVLLTRADYKIFRRLKKIYPDICYSKLARSVYLYPKKRIFKKGLVLIITAGTSDIPVAEEAAVTLDIMGNRIERLYDAGVAGIHRVLKKEKLIKEANVIIVVAGMEGALASVVSGMVSVPVIAVPTSVGYGASFQGLSSLLTMLNSCSPGVVVVNIDNGFGAGYFAGLINR
jgi:hypothetical protein